MQLNGINLQPKIGSDFNVQYGTMDNNVTNKSTMEGATNPSAQNFNQGRINQTANPDKMAENIAKYEAAQSNVATLNRQFFGL